MTAPKQAKQGGFTLMELVVALALMSIVILGVMSLFQNILGVYAQIRDNRDSSAQLRSFIGLLGDDLRTLSVSYTMIGEARSFFADTARLMEFVSGISIEKTDAQPHFTEVLVIYKLRPEEDGTFTLLRIERPHPSVYGLWKDTAMPVLEHLEQIDFTYEYSEGAWQPSCYVPPGGALPKFVHLRAVLRYGERKTEYTITFPVGKVIL